MNYTPRTAGRIILRADVSPSGAIAPLLLEDVASLDVRFPKQTSFRRLNGKPGIIVNAIREQGSNVVATMLRLRSVVDELNQNELDQRGLTLRVVYDETKYISSAIDLVQQNIWIGGMLAFTILMLFSDLPTPIFAAILFQ